IDLRGSMFRVLASEKPSFGFIPSIVTTAIISLAVGYWIGRNASIRSFGTKKRHPRRGKANSDSGGSSSSDLSSEGETDIPQYDDSVYAGEECKLVLPLLTKLIEGFSRPDRFRNDERQSCNFLYNS